MPLVHPCSEPGCETLTMGPHCVAHERRPDAPVSARRRGAAVAVAIAVTATIVAAVAARLRLEL